MLSIRQILPPQPHYLSGYSGFVPGYKFHCGQSYGRLTHDLFMDRTDRRTLVLADLTTGVKNAEKISPDEKSAFDQRCRTRVCKYSADMTPGYAGHVPQYEFACGNVFSVDAATGLVTSEQMKRACLCPECNARRGNSANKYKITEADGNTNTHSFVKVPGGTRLFKDKYEHHLPTSPSPSPYFLENENPHKKFVNGYAGHVPFLTFQHGLPYAPATNKALQLFTARRERLESNSFVPIATTARPEIKRAYEKLPYENGMIKNYAGHIPGNKFYVGKTISEGSKEARNILGQTAASS